MGNKIKKNETMIEFFRIARRFMKHLEEEGYEISPTEIGHLAIICQEEIDKAIKKQK